MYYIITKMPNEIIKLGKRYIQVTKNDKDKSKKPTIEKAKKKIKLSKYQDYLQKQNKYL